MRELLELLGRELYAMDPLRRRSIVGECEESIDFRRREPRRVLARLRLPVSAGKVDGAKDVALERTGADRLVGGSSGFHGLPMMPRRSDLEEAAHMAVKITTQQGDTWDEIAARELGNRTLGGEVAGYNGFAAHQAVPIGVEILIPHRTAPPEDAKGNGSKGGKAKGS